MPGFGKYLAVMSASLVEHLTGQKQLKEESSGSISATHGIIPAQTAILVINIINRIVI